MKLEARHRTSDILSDIDEITFQVSNLSAKIAFNNLLPTCEIGDEIAEYYLSEVPRMVGNSSPPELAEHLDSIGRQRSRCCDRTCECRELPDVRFGPINLPTISQPFLFTDAEHWEFRAQELDMSENDADAVSYCLSFYGHDHARFEIDYGGIKTVNFEELHEEIHYDEDRDR